MKLLEAVKKRTSQATGLRIDQLDKFPYEGKSVLHDPFLYDDMQKTIELLHKFKQVQRTDPKSLLIIDTDYDTDGIMAASVMAASLDVLDINFRVYCPDMRDGYGLSPTAIDKMKSQFEVNGYHIGLILTADNGTNAIDGVNYAKKLNIPVIVTDHHLTTFTNADSLTIVNPNKTMTDGTAEPYPFKGNAGGTVIWKVMLAYSSIYDPDKYNLIYDLIVFAGIANVADVMPITNENHYIVKIAVKELNRLWNIYDAHLSNPYIKVKNTKYPHYNAVFYGLYDLISKMQDNYNAKRQKQGKKPYPLPRDEELISWYLAPALNAPRRVVGSSLNSMQALIALNKDLRYYAIDELLRMNSVKTLMRNEVFDYITENITSQNDELIDAEYLNNGEAHSLFVNTKHGISGLIAGMISNISKTATIVFALPTTSDHKVYSTRDIQNLLSKYPNLTIAASARSIATQPLDEIIKRIRINNPDLTISGGGHTFAAGYSIKLRDLKRFTSLFKSTASIVENDYINEYKRAVLKGEIKPQISNSICLSLIHTNTNTEQMQYIDINYVPMLNKQLLDVYNFEDTLKPFGHEFNGQTHFYLEFTSNQLTHLDLNRHFWKTFKFNLHGIDCITFNTDLAKQILDDIDINENSTFTVKAKLNMNEFMGRKKLQLILVQ